MDIYNIRNTQFEKRRYFPVVAIIAAVATLILLLLIYTSRNLILARHRLEESLLQEGVTLIRAIEAGNRTGMRMSWALNQLQTLVEELGKAPKVAYISVIGGNGEILAHNLQENIGRTVTIDLNSFTEHSSAFFTRTVNVADGTDVFEIIATTEARGNSTGMNAGNFSGIGHRHGMGRHHGLADVTMIRLGMSMSELQQIQTHDMKDAFLMLLVLSAAGSAALYFIVLKQNYYAVNHAFHAMRSYTQHVVDSMANGLISLDNKGKIVTMNRQAHQILQIPQSEPIQEKALTDVLRIHDCDILSREEPVLEKEVVCTTSSQRSFPLSLSASKLEDNDGHELGTVLLFRDLSDVKALQEQIKRSERLASLGQLAAGIAHEIRNPLGSLKGFLQYFQRKLSLQDQDKTYLTVMMKEVDRLNSVISNLLDFARPKEPVLDSCELPELLHHVLTLIKSDLQAKQLALSLDIQEYLPQIRLDRDQITQVILNILLNAIHATEPGGQILIEAHLQSDANRLELTISDNGKGIAPENVSKVFDPFFSTKKQGTGLGLAVAYSIIEYHHGEMTVESKEGNGSTFRINLPTENTPQMIQS